MPFPLILRPVLEKHLVTACDLFEAFHLILKFRKCVGRLRSLA